MAWSDYKICDQCGDAKVFYDANIDDERYLATCGEPSRYDPIGLKAICGECNKTHEVIIVHRTATPDPVLSDPRVKALVEAAHPFDAAVFNDNGDVTISTGNIKTAHWLRLSAALRAIGGEA